MSCKLIKACFLQNLINEELVVSWFVYKEGICIILLVCALSYSVDKLRLVLISADDMVLAFANVDPL